MRKVYLDNLRYGIVITVVIYHVFYMFNSLGIIRNVDVAGIPQLDVVMYTVYPWFMFALFLIAGVSARYALGKRSNKEFLKERTRRVLVPSLAGIFLLGWIAGLVTDQYADMFQGAGDVIPGVVKYLVYCASGIGALWFLHELFLASLVLVLLLVLDKQDALWRLGGRARLWTLFLLFFAVWGSAQVLNTPLMEVYRNGFYIFGFLLGYYVFSHEQMQEMLKKYHLLFLGIAVITGVIYVVRFWGLNYADAGNLRSMAANLYAWFGTLGVLACGTAWFDRETGFTRYMRPRSFGFFVLHIPLMVVIIRLTDVYLDPPAWGFYIITLAGTAVLLPLVTEAVRRIPVVRRLLLGL